ncbi:MAG: PDZ domain-containing protein [Pyrinomonadaceae bacterium]
MSKDLRSKATLFLAFISLFFMYQETPAQKKSAKGPKTAPTVVKAVPPDIAYIVSMSKPSNHLLEVEMRVSWSQMPDKTELKMPVWTPGSYLVREYARHVQDFSVKDANGADLGWRKISKNTWQVDSKGSGQFVAKYRVYANELTVRTNELNDEHAFWNNGALLFFVKDHLNISSTVTVNPFGNWKAASGLPVVTGTTNTFRAENYDVLYDSPFEVSDFTEVKFDVQGKPHRYVITGEGNFDTKKMAADTTKIIEAAYQIFDELPYDDYTFILNLRGGGGLEHLNSTALQFNKFGFKPDARYKAFLGLVAHEYFHLWNVKRIRPEALGPFDYENENYTKSLWLAEGGTEYFSNLLLVRAGITSPKDFLNGIARGIQQLQARPGRLETSLEEASFDAWVKYYRQDENAINNQISYYDKGELVTMMLDLTIRSASGGAKSIDDVMRYLYAETFKKGRGYTPDELQKAAEMMAGKSLDDFFAKYVRGRDEIDYNAIVNDLGLQLKSTTPNASKAYIGADTAEDGNGRLNIRSVPADTPAYDQGLNTGDQIVAIDGYRANQTFFQSYLTQKKPGDKVRLSIFRLDELRDVEFTLGGNRRAEYSFAPVAEPTELQKKLYREYLNADL